MIVRLCIPLGSYLYKRNNSLASSTGRPHPLYSASNTSLGVDLGSSSMRIAALLARSSLDPSEASTPLAKRAEVLESRTGHRATPAFVNVGSSEAIAGEVARSRRFSHSSTTVILKCIWNSRDKKASLLFFHLYVSHTSLFCNEQIIVRRSGTMSFLAKHLYC